MENDEVVYCVGHTMPGCVYDVAVVLSLVIDTIGIDQKSEFYKILNDLNNSAWASLPPVLTMDFREPEKVKKDCVSVDLSGTIVERTS